jgi:hypothetical protein
MRPVLGSGGFTDIRIVRSSGSTVTILDGGLLWATQSRPSNASSDADAPGGSGGTRAALYPLGHDASVGHHDHAVIAGACLSGILGQLASDKRRSSARIELDEHVGVDRIDKAVAMGQCDSGVAPLVGDLVGEDLRAPALVQRRRVHARDESALSGGVTAVAVYEQLVAIARERDVWS